MPNLLWICNVSRLVYLKPSLKCNQPVYHFHLARLLEWFGREEASFCEADPECMGRSQERFKNRSLIKH